ncbi:hypothetical protein [Daejeonella oryzae]|uniref:hypothetical protein n=1 Tax=Daejeonella oryzae TaxID=1122943 RepID=UPI0003F62964|nr:hypothetical protein [Daejeonella oryzae]
MKELKNRGDILLVIGAVVLTFLFYQFGIKNTIVAYQTNEQLKNTLKNNSLESLPQDFLLRKSRNLDKVLEKYSVDSLIFRSKSIGEVASIAEAENLKLLEIAPLDPFYSTENFLVQKIDFEGDYYSIVKFIRRVQNQHNVGIIRSINIQTQTKGPAIGKNLKIELYLQIKK